MLQQSIQQALHAMLCSSCVEVWTSSTGHNTSITISGVVKLYVLDMSSARVTNGVPREYVCVMVGRVRVRRVWISRCIFYQTAPLVTSEAMLASCDFFFLFVFLVSTS